MNLTDKCRHGEELRYVCKLCEGDIDAFEEALVKSAKECSDAETEWTRVDEEAKALRARVAELEAREVVCPACGEAMSASQTGTVRELTERAMAAEQRVVELERERDGWKTVADRRLSELARAEASLTAAEQRVAELEREVNAGRAERAEHARVVRERDGRPQSETCERCLVDDAKREYVGDPEAIADALLARVADLETALATLLDAAERQAAGFPLESELWFAVRDYARARLPEKRAEEVECG